ncbi:hypothetical protein DMB95_00155 [Campylobacter sp. MIT 12-8780]|uniref:hypothetical protein n=1 Tax=unclassified Campylobacter TaxID=2593542 RepID=UPI00115F3215|nr:MULTISPECIES: hypothetical protein [unclassified Campylobacter]NDJ26371.1 hypothetical protein [Campylobacter sp. MIT 19-121]TQR42948.1 hypothetical protein DMB95_00155 [Campylobacter sp. MIT 12-8780]
MKIEELFVGEYKKNYQMGLEKVRKMYDSIGYDNAMSEKEVMAIVFKEINKQNINISFIMKIFNIQEEGQGKQNKVYFNGEKFVVEYKKGSSDKQKAFLLGHLFLFILNCNYFEYVESSDDTKKTIYDEKAQDFADNLIEGIKFFNIIRSIVYKKTKEIDSDDKINQKQKNNSQLKEEEKEFLLKLSSQKTMKTQKFETEDIDSSSKAVA